MTEEQLREIERLIPRNEYSGEECEWIHRQTHSWGKAGSLDICTAEDYYTVAENVSEEYGPFLASTLEAVPSLIAEVRRLREENENNKAAIFAAAARKANKDPEAWAAFLKCIEIRTDGAGG